MKKEIEIRCRSCHQVRFAVPSLQKFADCPQCVKYCETRAIVYADPREAYERLRGRSARPGPDESRSGADPGDPGDHPEIGPIRLPFPSGLP